jgi:hypothetical protein
MLVHSQGALELACIAALLEEERHVAQVSKADDGDDSVFTPLVLSGAADALRQLLHITLQNGGWQFAAAVEHVNASQRVGCPVVCRLGLQCSASGSDLSGAALADGGGAKAAASCFCCSVPVFDDVVARELGVSLVTQLLRLVLNADCIITNQPALPSGDAGAHG